MAHSGPTCIKGWVLTFALFALSSAQPAEAKRTLQLTSADDLSHAISVALPGTILELAGGDYGGLALKGAGGANGAPIILRSANPTDPARITSMELREVSHLVLDGLLFDYSYDKKDKQNRRPFQVIKARDLIISNSVFDGDLAIGDNIKEEGYPTGFGFSARDSAQITLENNEIHNFYRGLVLSDCEDVVIRGNNVHSIRSDAMDFAQVERVKIEMNYIHDFKRAADSADHADMIQFWTNQTEHPSVDITIRDNVLNSGIGTFTQSIFMRNDQVDTGRAGEEMFYRNVIIENNVIINAHLHGITVGETNGLKIRNNTLVHNTRSDGKTDKPALWAPQIRVADTSRNVEITRNVMAGIHGNLDQTDWSVTDNFFIQDIAPDLNGYYDNVFIAARTGNPQNFTSFGYLPGGELDGSSLGSSLLMAGGLEKAGLNLIRIIAPAPAIRIAVDPDLANHFTFAAILEGGAGKGVLNDVALVWDFGDGTTGEGAEVTHRFAKPGIYQVKMQVHEVDGAETISTAELQIPSPDVLVYTSHDGVFKSFAIDGTLTVVDIPPSEGPTELGGDVNVQVIPAGLIKPFFGANAFELKMRVRGKKTYKAAGELLRIHQSLLVTINERGIISLQFNTLTAAPLMLSAGPVRIYSGNWVDLTFRYSAMRQLFQIEVNGKVISEGHTSGITRPMQSWGLVLGNPFHNKKTFEGELDSLALRVGTYDYGGGD